MKKFIQKIYDLIIWLRIFTINNFDNLIMNIFWNYHKFFLIWLNLKSFRANTHPSRSEVASAKFPTAQITPYFFYALTKHMHHGAYMVQRRSDTRHGVGSHRRNNKLSASSKTSRNRYHPLLCSGRGLYVGSIARVGGVWPWMQLGVVGVNAAHPAAKRSRFGNAAAHPPTKPPSSLSSNS